MNSKMYHEWGLKGYIDRRIGELNEPQEVRVNNQAVILTNPKKHVVDCAFTEGWAIVQHKLEAPIKIAWELSGEYSVDCDDFVFARAGAERPTELHHIFAGLVKKWKDETSDYSVNARRYEHSSYRAILDLGTEVVPEILKELRRDPDRWFHALEKLTHVNPASRAETFYEAVDIWIAWGVSEDFMPP